MNLIFTLLKKLVLLWQTWFIWLGWIKARPAMIELVADSIISLSVWLAYAFIDLVLARLLKEGLVLSFAESIHVCAAILSFSLLAGAGLLHLTAEVMHGHGRA